MGVDVEIGPVMNLSSPDFDNNRYSLVRSLILISYYKSIELELIFRIDFGPDRGVLKTFTSSNDSGDYSTEWNGSVDRYNYHRFQFKLIAFELSWIELRLKPTASISS